MYETQIWEIDHSYLSNIALSTLDHESRQNSFLLTLNADWEKVYKIILFKNAKLKWAVTCETLYFFTIRS
jgi:hypothetical protein